MKSYVIVLGGGSGRRMGAQVNKVLLPLCGVPVIIRAIVPFTALCDGCVVVAAPQEVDTVRALLARYRLNRFVTAVVAGGSERQYSVQNGFAAVPEDADAVLVHDGARPLVDEDIIRRCLAGIEQHGSGVAAIASVDTVKLADADGQVRHTPNRSEVYAVQTPQGFRCNLYRTALEKAHRDGFLGTDDASLLEHAGLPVHLCEGSRENLKLTTAFDVELASMILARRNQAGEDSMFRIGQGYDVHRLVDNRRLVLCGVEIPHETGLLGHSDADVAIHALMDALIGAMGLGDIGKWFPDTDEQYRGADSVQLLMQVCERMRQNGYELENCDVTIVAQRPKLRPYIDTMRERLAQAMQVPQGRISVKATTTERLGFEGEEKGISAQAVCLLRAVSR